MKVLFVCTANLCRSPMAEALFNDLAEERGLPFWAESAGVAARKGYGMAPHAREALYEIGASAGGHSSRRVSKPMLDEADLILVMGARHASEIGRILGPSGKVHHLARYAGEASDEEIPDPYGMTLFAYRASARQLYEYVEGVLDRMEKEYSASEAHPQ
ncbi:MAG: low molecular weight protein arginine phosphatase [Actinomycetota bacterium]|nr:low molecular weight protein arginine phosphatase [Actinomycetota bacterium]